MELISLARICSWPSDPEEGSVGWEAGYHSHYALSILKGLHNHSLFISLDVCICIRLFPAGERF